jgi:hypothetical protein
MSAELSICIPTRNRAPFLQKCLSHLKGFSRLRLEVIVSDNASEDATPKVARAFEKGAFERFHYHRHRENVGVARNTDTALRLGSAPYLWCLSDDDIAYESALIFLRDLLERTPAAVAACGGYGGVRGMNVGIDRFQAPASIVAIEKGDLAGLAGNVIIADGHPMMRREVFQRRCRLEERGFGLLPLYGRLLRYGDVLYADAHIMEHLANPDSLSTRMTEPWFIDSYSADIELAMAGGAQPVPLAAVDGAKNKAQGWIYLNAARMARMQGDALLMRHFLLRAKAVHQVDAGTLVHWESNFLLEAAAQRLAQLLQDLGAKRILLEDLPVLRTIAAQLEPAVPGADWRFGLPARDAQDRQEVRVRWSGGEGGVAFLDVVDGCRLTDFPIRVLAEGGSARIEFEQPDAARMLEALTRGFALMMEDYRTEEP